ncbi:hypothetical protein [Streptomyces sp. S186]|uniref:hypothetical protein n=1 Tax=Streptomyces sp. S186 TaxID=3434395 RepID=UPI003F67AAC0
MRHDIVRDPLPGGGLEEFDCDWASVPAAPDETAAALFGRVHSALIGLLREAEADPLFGPG